MSWERVCAEIESQPKLSPAEEQALRAAHLDGDERAKPKLISCTLRYALGTARGLAKESGRWEPGDLLGEAVQAMAAAVDRWDGRGSFAGYAQARIRGSMQDFLRRRANVMRAPSGSDSVLSLDAPEGENGRTLLDSQVAPEAAAACSFGLSAREVRVMNATILRQPRPATAGEAAAELGLNERTVSKILRSALRKSPATCRE
ncbi:MAG: hypothetical protein JWO82_3511 [Akkermansiaceae bacterium]|nr:hypothetical protein [Akkermansiaceae bacterium]